jgi:hypothetical protein
MHFANSFIDESFMNPCGEPLDFPSTFGRIVEGLEVEEASQEEWDEAVKKK